MGKKLIINENQYNLIVNYENKKQLNESKYNTINIDRIILEKEPVLVDTNNVPEILKLSKEGKMPLDKIRVESMINLLKNKKSLPPLILDKNNKLKNGFHRYMAYKLSNIDNIPFEINNNSNYFNENFNNKKQLNEDWKGVVLGTAMLLGLNLSGQNKLIGQEAINNDSILNQIKRTLESDKIEDVAESLENAGLKNALDRIEDNAQKIEAKFNAIAKNKNLNYKLSIKTAESEKELQSKLKQGYAIKDIKTKKQDAKQEMQHVVEVSDTLDISFGSDNFFITAGYQLSKESIDTLITTLNSIKEQNGKILNVNIESSTDTEPIKMGNKKLSELRTNSIKDLLVQQGINNNDIITNVLFDQGENLYSTSMSKEQRLNARKQTSKYRYVKVSMTVLFEETIPEVPVAPQVISQKEYELVKIIETSGKKGKIGTFAKFRKKFNNCKIFKLTKNQKGGNPSACPVWD